MMEDFADIQPVSTAEEPPKRGPGRPRKDGTPAQPRDANAPKRTYTKRKKRDFTADIASLLTLTNFAFLFVPDAFKDDALSPDEINALSVAINKSAQENSRIYQALEFAFTGGGSSTLSLLAVIGAIAIKRLGNHSIIPPEFASHTGTFMAMMTGGNLEFSSSPA